MAIHMKGPGERAGKRLYLHARSKKMEKETMKLGPLPTTPDRSCVLADLVKGGNDESSLQTPKGECLWESRRPGEGKGSAGVWRPG